MNPGQLSLTVNVNRGHCEAHEEMMYARFSIGRIIYADKYCRLVIKRTPGSRMIIRMSFGYLYDHFRPWSFGGIKKEKRKKKSNLTSCVKSHVKLLLQISTCAVCVCVYVRGTGGHLGVRSSSAGAAVGS